MTPFSCPLCSSTDKKRSWLTLSFMDKLFAYDECLVCRSLICRPMPDESVLSRMYDASYCETADSYGEDASLAKFSGVLDFLRTLAVGTFIDFGCGDGKLLLAVKAMGWDVSGIDFNPEFAVSAKAAGIPVTSPHEPVSELADVLHLGDVLEHLTDLNNQFPEIINRLKHGGYLIAHGPLEANSNLFFKVIRLGKRLRGSKPTDMPPFHVILATTTGQLCLFERFSFAEVALQIDEIAFPAAEQLTSKELRHARSIALFLLRKTSQLFSRFNTHDSGNRYFYVGRRLGSGG